MALRDAPDGTRGTASLRNFILRETALKRMAAATPSTASVRNEATASAGAGDPDIMRFDRLTANFVRAGGRLDCTTP